jgi:hypothetical protein
MRFWVLAQPRGEQKFNMAILGAKPGKRDCFGITVGLIIVWQVDELG